MRILMAAALCQLPPLAASAQVAGLPQDARLEAEEVQPLARTLLPAGPWRRENADLVTANGWTRRQAWQIAASGLTSAQLLAPVRDALEQTGFQSVYHCVARDCGGFEFRYALDLLPEPAMHVDLGDFEYLLARRGGGAEAEYVALLVSRAQGRGFVHVTETGPTEFAPGPDSAGDTGTPGTTPPITAPRPMPRAESEPVTRASTGPRVDLLPGQLVSELETMGRAVLADLTFETGSARLADTAFASLAELADWLRGHPESRIVLVGHTDATGALASNIALSRKRAEAVLERLRQTHGIDARRMAAEGVGYLAPLVSNATEAGRTVNRRVEVVLAGSG